MRTWEAWAAGGEPDRPIDTRDFEATGGLGAALSNHADEIYDALPDDRHRAACEKVFKALTVKGEDNRGIRRPTRLAQLRAIAGSDAETVKAVLDAFRPGCHVPDAGQEVELGDRTVLDLSHESLMRGWERLRGGWRRRRSRRGSSAGCRTPPGSWRDGRASLFRNPDLQIAVSWRDQQAPNAEWAEEYGGDFEPAIGFLEASKAEADAERQGREAARQHELDRARELAEAQQLRLEHQRHSARRLRKMIGGLAVVAVIAVAACVVAMIANRRANRLADDARQSAERAEQSRLETKNALGVVESQKTAVEGSLSKAEAAEAARAAAEAGRKLTDYTTDMRLAPFVWSDDRTSAEQLRALLAKHVPEAPGPAGDQVVQAALATPDLRGFEWHYHQHLLEASATVFSGHGDALVGCSFTPDGQLVTLDQKGQMRRWDPGSEVEDEAGRRDLPGGPGAACASCRPAGG